MKVINRSANALPQYSTLAAAGMDVRAQIESPITIGPLERVAVPTGLYMEIPVGCEVQVRPRSGLAAKHGITVLNSPGTIDADYRGEIMVALFNHAEQPVTVEHGERIAQMVITPYLKADFHMVDELSDTVRGEGGFGSTGSK